MHVAVCDDNVADRKQMERLLARESDKRASTSGVLYIDSFGNAQALLNNPMLYDIFYIDMCHTPGINGSEVIHALLQKGVVAPIILCCSVVNYRDFTFPEQVHFLDKPIQTLPLSQSLDLALTMMKASQPLIELRASKQTVYVTEGDILYAIEDGHSLNITLTDGRSIVIADSAENFFQQVEIHPSFFSPTPKVVLNGRYMTSLHHRKAAMTDGAVFKISRDCLTFAKELLKEKGEGSD
jgi:DNA-binding LytR/AlgR family response regulator